MQGYNLPIIAAPLLIRNLAVVYRVSELANWNITIPSGFIAEDKAQVRRVADYVNGYLREFVAAHLGGPMSCRAQMGSFANRLAAFACA